MELQPTHLSTFSRFSDKLKSSTRRKPSNTLPIPPDALAQHDRHHQDAAHRRRSMATYSTLLRHMFTSHAAPPAGKAHVNALPTELLSCILQHLDFFTLLRAQRVCTLWRALVPGSAPLLAQTLYLRPSRELQMYSCVPARFELEFDAHPRMRERERERGKGAYRLSRRCSGLVRMGGEIVFHPVVECFGEFVPGLVAGVESERVRGSWRDMLVSMPPLREVSLRPGWKTREPVVRVLRVKEGKEGITLEDLLEGMDMWSRDCEIRDAYPLE